MNRLAGHPSAYLRQHADDPVEWWPWSEEAFVFARAKDRLVLVSIGYSACHWCHVMGEETFRDPEVAEFLNRHFVCIKVDREDHPDVDAFYMAAILESGKPGGWPLNVFATPEGAPIYAVTYLPPRRRGGLVGLIEVASAVAEAWRTKAFEIRSGAEGYRQAVEEAMRGPLTSAREERSLVEAVLARALSEAEAAFDPEFGGFGTAPKFPNHWLLVLLGKLSLAPVAGEPMAASAKQMLRRSLLGMARGGIRDHIGGGFFRYATDQAWRFPHFEKMTYDQAGMVRSYLWGERVLGEALFGQVAKETLTWLLDEMGGPEGAIGSSLDADSPDGEGVYYLWKPAQLVEVVGRELAERAAAWWGVSGPGPYEGSWLPMRPPDGELEEDAALRRAKEALLAARKQRRSPRRDDKVVLEYNAMVAVALADAASLWGDPLAIQRASQLVSFLFSALRDSSGRWRRSWSQGKLGPPGVASDYAWLALAAVRLAEVSGESAWLEAAEEVALGMLALFFEEAEATIYLTGKDVCGRPARALEHQDGPTGSPEGVALGALTRLAWLGAASEISEAADLLAANALVVAEAHPLWCASNLCALHERLFGPIEIVIPGRSRQDLVDVALRSWRPGVVISWGEAWRGELWSGKQEGLAYLCRDGACAEPALLPEELSCQLEALALSEAGGPAGDDETR
jgi:uncharacterized protein YyaL (SSP411 family)